MEEKNVVTDNNLDTKFEHKDYKSQSLNTFILTQSYMFSEMQDCSELPVNLCNSLLMGTLQGKFW